MGPYWSVRGTGRPERGLAVDVTVDGATRCQPPPALHGARSAVEGLTPRRLGTHRCSAKFLVGVRVEIGSERRREATVREPSSGFGFQPGVRGRWVQASFEKRRRSSRTSSEGLLCGCSIGNDLRSSEAKPQKKLSARRPHGRAANVAAGDVQSSRSVIELADARPATLHHRWTAVADRGCQTHRRRQSEWTLAEHVKANEGLVVGLVASTQFFQPPVDVSEEGGANLRGGSSDVGQRRLGS